MINSTDWDSLLSEDIHSSWKNWHSKFMEIMHSCTPQGVPKKSLPWINKQILQTFAKRNACYRLLKSTALVVSQPRISTNTSHWETKLWDSYGIQKTSTSITSTLPINKMLNNTPSSIPSLATSNGLLATTSNEKAKVLNHYFFSLLLPHLALKQSWLLRSIWLLLYLNLISLNPQGLMVYQPKCWNINIAPSLTKLFNLSITTGCCTGAWLESCENCSNS